MQESLISFETAKLAKEKGFDIPCLNFYTNPKCKMFGIDEEGRYYSMKNKANSLWVSGNAATLDSKHVYYTPTQSLLQKWLRDVHKIFVSPRESWGFDDTLAYVCEVNGKFASHNIQDKPFNRFDTYEEALEEGLKLGLSLINV